MKIGRFEEGGAPRIGVVGALGDRTVVLDAARAVDAAGGGRPIPGRINELIARGRPALDELRSAWDRAIASGEEGWFRPVTDVHWLVPTEPRTVVCAGRNFGRHRDESLAFWTKKGVGIHFEFPTGFLKLPHLLAAHGETVAKPSWVEEFDYEVEVAAIIGSEVADIGEGEALGHVFGYTVLNDLSARDWQRKEMQNQMIVVGKNFPGCAPIGPWILTADEVPDPSALVVDLKVNGATLQHERCSDMIFDFAKLIAFWSRLGYAPGDVVASGTPEGVAMHRKPDPFAYYLKPGDVVEATVEQIGTLETKIA